MTGEGLRIAHVQPMSLDLFGHDDRDFGTRVRYSMTNLPAAQAQLGERPTVHLLTSGRATRQHFDGVDVVFHRCAQPPRRLGLERRFARQVSLSMLRAVNPGRADVVHFHGPRQFHGMFAAVARRAATVGLPLVAQDRGTRDVGRLETAAQRYALRRCRAVLAASADGREVLAQLGVPPERLQVLPNGVDRGCFHPAEHPPPDPGRALRVLAVTRLTAEKDPLTMAGGVAALAGRGRAVTLTVIGEGGPLRAQVHAIAEGAGVPVTFHDHLPQEDLAVHYRDADALVATSHGEGWNQAVLEAMASGLPAVVADVPGLRDAAGQAGVLVPGEPAAIAAALERLGREPGYWRDARERGLARAQQFTWESVALRLQPLYRLR